MRVIRTVARQARHHGHHDPTRHTDRENLSELERWATRGASRESVPPPTPSAPPTPPPSVRDRPVELDAIVGQAALVDQLKMVCRGAQVRGTPMPHVLLSGPPGLGKTTLAGVIAHTLGSELVTTTGMMMRKPADVVGLLIKSTGKGQGTVLFVDEVHAMSKPATEVLYEALEDAKVSTIMGSGTEAVAYTHELPGFVCVGATTDPGKLAQPFRDRFGYQGVLEEYSTEEIATIVERAWARVSVGFGPEEPFELALRSKGVPRRALHLAERVLDYAAVEGEGPVTEGLVATALARFGIDEAGLDEVDFKILTALTGNFAGRSVGLDSLAQYLNMDPTTLSKQYEPFLVRSELVTRLKGGRMATPKAYELLEAVA